MSTPDFFRSRLDAMIDLRHPLAVLATKMSWASIETTLAPLFERRSRDGRVSEAVDLFGSNSLELAGGVSAAGRPRLPMRLMVGLLYLKHAYNESDETVCERWAQDVYFQFFCGEEYFQPRLPCDPTNLVRFRQALGEAGVAETVADAILNHRQSATRGGVMGICQRASRWPEQVKAMELWGRLLNGALDGRVSHTKVVPTPARVD